MNKNKLIAISAVFATLIGCNLAGIGGAATISAKVTQGNCGNLQNGQNCQVTLTYNTGNESGATLGVTYTPAQPTGQFNAVFSGCSLAAGEQTCNVPVTYVRPSNGRPVQQDLVFTLGNAKSDPPIRFVGQ